MRSPSIGEATSGDEASFPRGQANRRLELVSAGIARPEMTHAPLADVLGPFWADERVATFAARLEAPGSNGVSRLDDIELHCSLPVPPQVAAHTDHLWR